MSSWKDIRKYQQMSQIAQAADNFRQEQETNRLRSPADVFVSYSSPDRDTAHLLSRRLEEEGVAFFLDQKEIRSGDELSSRLEEEIRKRKYYLLLLSKHSAVSRWVTYEWALAKGAGSDVRILRVDPDAPIPGPLSNFVAGSDLEDEVAWYVARRYDRLSLQVLIRDLFRPSSPEELLKYRPVVDQPFTWEHPDIARWEAEEKERAFLRQFDLAGDPGPKISRVQVRPDEVPPKWILHCELQRPFELAFSPAGQVLTVRQWWMDNNERTILLHPAFWRATIQELIALLEGRATLVTRHGTAVNNLFPVTWA
jgi:hypothetical protein